MSFTDQKPRYVTEEEVIAPWGGGKNGIYFRCYLCGHQFIVGDYFRWVLHEKMNFITCNDCDGDDVYLRWEQALEEVRNKYWWAIKGK